MSKPSRERNSNTAKNVSNRQKKQRPDERCYELDADKMTKGNFKKPQYNKGGMVQPVKKLRQKNHMKRISLNIRQIFLDALHH